MMEPAASTSAAGTETEDLRAALGQSSKDALCALLLEHCGQRQFALAVKDVSSGRYLWSNAAFRQLALADTVIGRVDADVFPKALSASLRAAEQSALTAPAGGVAEHRFESSQGARSFSVLRVPLAAAEGTAPPLLASLWTDVSAERAREARLATALAQIEGQQRAYESLRRERSAVEDDAGAGALDALMRREIDLSSREHREFALALAALDPVAPGTQRDPSEQERIEHSVARLIREGTRAMDTSCRLGGGRFAVLLSGVGLAIAHARMESLRRQCAGEIVMHGGRELPFSVAMGVASFPHTADAPAALLDAARGALAEAERRGGNQVVLASIAFQG